MNASSERNANRRERGDGFAGRVSSVSTLLIFGNVKLPALKISNKKAQEKDTCARWNILETNKAKVLNMNLINRIFRRNMVDCKRCLGKGQVDLEDIKRLKKELFWGPGKCAYCNGIGKVPPDRLEKVSADFEYLTTNLPSLERHRVLNGDQDALKRAGEFKELFQRIIQDIEHLYCIDNMEPNEIAQQIFHKQGRQVFSQSEKQELIDYIEKVIKSKLKH